MRSENERFEFQYNAKHIEEVKKIRAKYVKSEENKLEQLRRLDEGVNTKSTMFSLVVGIIGALLLGVGMSCVLVWGSQMTIFVLGIIVGIIGIVPIGCAYPIYLYVEKKEREKIAPEILRLTDELLK